MANKIGFIIPVLNDLRVRKCIESIRKFDDVGSCTILVMAGNSSNDFCDELLPLLSSDDKICRDPDEGLFDALNQGLKKIDSDIIGWLGADDYLSENISASKLLHEFKDGSDAVVYTTAYIRGTYISRTLHSHFSNRPYRNWGFHNPHFSSFLTRKAATKQEFQIHGPSRNQFADITYFSEIFKDINVKTKPEIGVFMAEGGVGSGSIKSVMVNLKGRFNYFKVEHSVARALLMVLFNYGWKIISSLKYKLLPKKIPQ